MAPDDRRALLLDAARSVFAERGYHAAGVADVITAAGVARGTFYNYFESKRAIFQAVLEALLEDLSSVVSPIDVRAPIGAQVLANLDRAVRAMMRPDVARLLFAEAVGIDAEGDAALRSFYESAAERLERALVLGQAMGVVRDGDMQVAARCLLGMLKEPVFEALLRGEDLDPERIVLELSRLLGVGLMKAPDA